MNVNRAALYQKLNGVKIDVSAALLRETASELGELIQELGGECRQPLLPGHAVRILDGNALVATDHRLKVSMVDCRPEYVYVRLFIWDSKA